MTDQQAALLHEAHLSSSPDLYVEEYMKVLGVILAQIIKDRQRSNYGNGSSQVSTSLSGAQRLHRTDYFADRRSWSYTDARTAVVSWVGRINVAL